MTKPLHRQVSSSLYPAPYSKEQSLIRFEPNQLTVYDRLVVAVSSLFFVGGVFWVPILYAWSWKRYHALWKRSKEEKEESRHKRLRLLYGTLLMTLTGLFIAGPHRTAKFGHKVVKVHQWSMWKSWLKFFAFEVVVDQRKTNCRTMQEWRDKQVILAISPHGLFPFGLAFAALTESSQVAFGKFRAVVATATELLPWVRDVLKWVNAVNASRTDVSAALASGDRIGLAPGGIAEMFEGYPKPGTHPDEEYMIVRRGIFRMAIQHGVPIIPVYCFGSSKLLKRLQLPRIVERLSLLLRTSLVVYFGQWGLPIPFRQRLLYVMGNPIFPPNVTGIAASSSVDLLLRQRTEEMFSEYCTEMQRIFDEHKESYGWGHKRLLTIKS